MWELISRALASLGPAALAISTAHPDEPLLPPDAPEDAATDDQELVEYEGMLVSASAAQRRRYIPDWPCRHNSSFTMHRSCKEGKIGLKECTAATHGYSLTSCFMTSNSSPITDRL